MRHPWRAPSLRLLTACLCTQGATLELLSKYECTDKVQPPACGAGNVAACAVSAPFLTGARAHQGRVGRSDYGAFLKNIRRLIFLSRGPAQTAAAARDGSQEAAGQQSPKDLHAATTVAWRCVSLCVPVGLFCPIIGLF